VSNCLKWLCDKSGCLGPSADVVPDLRSSCTEGFIAEVGPPPTDETRTGLSRE